MKKNFKILLLLLSINIGAYAQKEEIKEAQSYYSKGKTQEALAILKKIEYLIINAPVEVKSDFYFTKGNVYKDLASKNVDAAANFALAVGAYQDVLLYENDSQIYKYAFKASLALKEMKSKLVDGAYNDFKAENSKKAPIKVMKFTCSIKKMSETFLMQHQPPLQQKITNLPLSILKN